MDIIREMLTEDATLFGAWVAIGSTTSAEIMASAGYDFLIVDTQHGGSSSHDLLPMLQVIDGSGTPALVRVNWSDQAQIMRAIDLGAAGVVVPMVSTAEQARTAAEACRYPPLGIRSFGPVRSYYSGNGIAPQPICLVMVETAEALDNLDAIASTPGVDGILVGPVDLALSLGHDFASAFTMSEQVFAAVDEVVAACRRHHIISASAAVGLDNARELMRHGIQMVASGADSQMIRAGAAADLQKMRNWQAEGVSMESGAVPRRVLKVV